VVPIPTFDTVLIPTSVCCQSPAAAEEIVAVAILLILPLASTVITGDIVELP